MPTETGIWSVLAKEWRLINLSLSASLRLGVKPYNIHNSPSQPAIALNLNCGLPCETPSGFKFPLKI